MHVAPKGLALFFSSSSFSCEYKVEKKRDWGRGGSIFFLLVFFFRIWWWRRKRERKKNESKKGKFFIFSKIRPDGAVRAGPTKILRKKNRKKSSSRDDEVSMLIVNFMFQNTLCDFQDCEYLAGFVANPYHRELSRRSGLRTFLTLILISSKRATLTSSANLASLKVTVSDKSRYLIYGLFCRYNQRRISTKKTSSGYLPDEIIFTPCRELWAWVSYKGDYLPTCRGWISKQSQLLMRK